MANPYTGKFCTSCGQPFLEDDRIAVCDTCGQAVHLRCWRAQRGCGSPGCAGVLRQVIGPENADAQAPLREGPAPSPAETPQQRSITEDLTGDAAPAPTLPERPVAPPAPPAPPAPAPMADPADPQRPLRERPEIEGPRFVSLYESRPGLAQGNLPLTLEELTLLSDRVERKQTARCLFRSLSDRPIRALQVDLLCRDAQGRPLTPVTDYTLAEFNAQRGQIFGQEVDIPVPDPNTAAVDLQVKRLLYADGVMEQRQPGAAPVQPVPAPQAPLAGGQTPIPGGQTPVQPPQAPVQPPQAPVQAKKKSSPLKWIIPLAAVLTVAVLTLVGLLVVRPALRYNKAAALLQQGDYYQASQEFRELGDYKDSVTQARRASYQLGLRQMDAGQYSQAILSFQNATGYSDAKDRITQCQNLQAYDEAETLLNQGRYDEAAEAFDRLGDYEDARERAREAMYWKGIDLYNGERYEEAEDAFLAAGSYRDAEEMVLSCRYLNGFLLYDQGDYAAAVEIFDQLGDYEEAANWRLEAMYEYVQANPYADDERTVAYLGELVDQNFGDSQELYEQIFLWTVSFAINTDENDKTTNLSSISREQKIYFHIKLSGPNDGSGVHLTAKNYWPDGDVTDTDWDDGDWYDGSSGWSSYWYNNPSAGATGTLTVKVYADGQYVGEASVEITP